MGSYDGYNLAFNRDRTPQPFRRFGLVICGPISPITFDSYRFFITFLDTKTRYLSVKLLRTKDQAIDAFQIYANAYENNANNKRIRVLATDNGSEYTNKRFKALLEKKGITHQLSPVYTKEPNGMVERVNRTLMDKVRCLLSNANLPNFLWGEACLTATYLYNRTPHSSLNFKTPYEVKNDQKPDISHIQTFGSICFYKNKGNNIKKLDDRALKGILIGFNERLYKVFDINSKECIWVRDIHILENKFINDTDRINQNDVSKENYVEMSLNKDKSTADNFPTADDLSNTSQNDFINEYNYTSPYPSSSNENTESSIDPAINSLSQVRRSNRVRKQIEPRSAWQPRAFVLDDNEYDDDIFELALLVNINDEPITYNEARSSLQYEHWKKAMQDE
ncbi:hypothetical protein EPUL_005540, partial [Erysiphe pulchra]